MALLGNPNTGKTTVFNALCGTRQRVGNFPGVTVEKKVGSMLVQDRVAEVMDLPGLYSLKAVSPDEEVASDVIMGRLGEKKPDVILYILDATNVKRNLYLFSQLTELDRPIVVVLTMTDMLEREGIDLDTDRLEQKLGVPICPLVGRNAEQIEGIQNAIEKAIQNQTIPLTRPEFPEELEQKVDELYSNLNRFVPISRFEARELLFFKEHPLLEFYREHPDALTAVSAAYLETKESHYTPSIIALRRYRWADQILDGVETRKVRVEKSISAKIDRFLTHRVAGLLAFVGIMYVTFQAIYTWSGPFMDGIDFIFGALSSFVGGFLTDYPLLHSLVTDGIITGVGSVVIFLPQIAILFLFIAFLEDSGYLSRAAFLMDRLLGWSGLNGRAFIPMLSSFACAIPGVMATRIMPDARARLSTILIAPLMSCSARLPVYMLFIGAFIEPQYGAGWAAFSLFAMHLVGLVVSLPVAWFLNRGVLKTPAIPFVLEMPPYRLPQAYNLFYRTYEASKDFLIRAGSIIFAMSIVIWALSYFPRPDSVRQEVEDRFEMIKKETLATEKPVSVFQDLEVRKENAIAAAYLENSYLGQAGRFIQPVFAPLGFDWRLSVGILSAFPAREVIVTTMGIIFDVGSQADSESMELRKSLRTARGENGELLYTPLTAVVLMIFFALSSQCMSTLAIVKRELNSWSWTIFLFVYMTVLAYLLAWLVRVIGLIVI